MLTLIIPRLELNDGYWTAAVPNGDLLSVKAILVNRLYLFSNAVSSNCTNCYTIYFGKKPLWFLIEICPYGWMHFDNLCYQLRYADDQITSFDEASARCQEEGGNLAVIDG